MQNGSISVEFNAVASRADRALVSAAEATARLRVLEETLEARLASNLRAAEASSAANVTRLTAQLNAWLSSADARTDAKIQMIPNVDQARLPRPLRRRICAQSTSLRGA